MVRRSFTIVALLIALLCGAAAAYWWPSSLLLDRWSTTSSDNGEQQMQQATTSDTQAPQTQTDTTSGASTGTPPSSFATEPMIIGTTPVFASIADDRQERIRGLSGVPALRENEVKLFVFPHDDTWSFWMKDMNFSIDMIWVDASSTVVYIEENVAPETFPSSFEPTAPARYVIETVAGFTERHNIGVGDPVALPE